MLNRFFRGRGGRDRGKRQGEGGTDGGKGQGGGNKPGSGPGGSCVCPHCGHKMPHQIGQRCLDLSCPKCGTRMVRE